MNIKKSEVFHMGWDLCVSVRIGNTPVKVALQSCHFPSEIRAIADQLRDKPEEVRMLDAKVRICELLNKENEETPICLRCKIAHTSLEYVEFDQFDSSIGPYCNWCVTKIQKYREVIDLYDKVMEL